MMDPKDVLLVVTLLPLGALVLYLATRLVTAAYFNSKRTHKEHN